MVHKQIQSQIDNRHHEFMQNINKSFKYYLEQHPRVYERPETPKDVETKSVSKEIAKIKREMNKLFKDVMKW